MVIIFDWRDSFIWLIIAARVVDFPEPVGPVTKTNPLWVSNNSNKIGGRLKSSIKGTFDSILLKTAAVPFKVL